MTTCINVRPFAERARLRSPTASGGAGAAGVAGYQDPRSPAQTSTEDHRSVSSRSVDDPLTERYSPMRAGAARGGPNRPKPAPAGPESRQKSHCLCGHQLTTNDPHDPPSNRPAATLKRPKDSPKGTDQASSTSSSRSSLHASSSPSGSRIARSGLSACTAPGSWVTSTMAPG